MIDFGDLFAGDPAEDLAACWSLLPADAADRFHAAYRPTVRPTVDGAGADGANASGAGGADAATLRRARGSAVVRALVGILIGNAGDNGRPGGKPTWGPPAHAALRRLVATIPR